MKLFAKQLALASILANLAMPGIAAETIAIGVVGPVPTAPIRAGMPSIKGKHLRKPAARGSKKKAFTSKAAPKGAQAKKGAKKPSKPPAPVRPPQQEVDNLSKVTLAPGVVLKRHRGAININILDVDLKEASIDVKPVIASETFNRLDEVKDQAAKVSAIAAVNANYFKKDGTPLGTLMIDGEWMAGPLYERISMGFTANGDVYIDAPNLHGTLETSNPEVPTLWINNINQPRRSGVHTVLYTRRWGSTVKMPYIGTLIAVDADGKVVCKSTQFITVPYGGFVLSDTKYGKIAKLKVGDVVNLSWQASPDRWNNVVHAISGGPCLIRHGNLFVNLKGEHFRKNWTSNTIHARTAAGITRDKHLILVTVEGKHTLWEVAKLLKELGCVDAMNLDGGGSTTMVVKGDILTRNAKSFQRRVAAALAVLPRHTTASSYRKPVIVSPETNLTDMDSSPSVVQETSLADPLTNELTDENLTAKTARETALAPDIIEHPADNMNQTEVPAEQEHQGKKKKRKLRMWQSRAESSPEVVGAASHESPAKEKGKWWRFSK